MSSLEFKDELSLNLINSDLRAIYFKLPKDGRPIFLKLLVKNEPLYDINDVREKIKKYKMKHEKKGNRKIYRPN